MSLYEKVHEAVESAAPRRGSGFDVKAAAAVALGIGLVVALAFAFVSFSKPEALSVSLARTSLKAGDETTMKVTFRNITGKDLNGLTLGFSVIDTKLLLLKPPTYAFDAIAKDKERIASITLQALQGIDPGTYAIEVKASSPDMEDEVVQRFSIRIE